MAFEQLGLAVEHADSGGAEDLVAGEGVEIGVQRLHVHLHVRHGLRAIHQRQRARAVRHLDHLATGLMVPSAFETWREGHHAGARVEQFFVFVQQQLAPIVHGNDAQKRAVLLFAEHLPGDDVGVVLQRRR